ncbi:MAG TPA: hypothetical protein VGI81_16790 [Tepidisphaeraceae bacterium]|jgi:hypothetical protein
MIKKLLYSRWTLPLSIPLVVAGVLIYVWKADPFEPKRRSAARPVAAGRAPARHRQTQVLYLAAPKPLPFYQGRVFPSPLLRELVRQSMLLAAREELGLATRDGELRERPPTGAAAVDAALRLDVNYLRDSSLAYSIFDGNDAQQPLVQDEFGINGEEPTYPDWMPMLADAEAKSRGQYVQMLQGEGFSPVAKHVAPATQPAGHADVDAKLNELTEVAQFAALRETHAAIRTAGESPERLGILVRAYANLAQLTTCHWSWAHEVFLARSLLYAQRLVAADPNSAFARWHRAYALALAGLHKAALDDLAAAEALPHKEAAPAWVELLDPVCRYRTEKLAELAAADKARAPLAMYLCFLTVEHCGSTSAVLETGKAALEVNPLCMRLVDAMCRHAGVGYLHVLTEMGPGLFRSSLAASLNRLPDLPPDCRAQVCAARRNWQDPAVIASLCKSLVEAPDKAEFSWSALGRLLQEVNFVHVETRTEFLAQQLGSEPAPFVQASAVLVADHPFKPDIDALACYSSGNPDMTRIRRILKDFNIPVLRPPVTPAIRLTMGIDTPDVLQGNAAWRAMGTSVDHTAWDQEEKAAAQYMTSNWTKYPQNYLRIAHHVEDVSPHAPVAIALHIICDWNTAQTHVDEWERQFPGHPSVTGALAWQYTRLKEYAKAEPFFRAYLRKAPDA